MYYLDESSVASLLDAVTLMPHIEEMFAGMSAGRLVNFPVVREQLIGTSIVFGVKSGFDSTNLRLGIKAGGFWPANASRGRPNHQSTVLLIDAETGGPHALVSGNALTALRTAGASAVSVRHLSRESSRVLGVLGAGAQARTQIDAVLRQRQFVEVLISDTSSARAHDLVNTFSGGPVEFRHCPAEEMARNSDVIITLTPSTNAVVRAEWIRPGTHLCCVGADTKGKQELDILTFSKARVFCDARAQAISIGECQHAFAAGLISDLDVVEIGEVIAGTRKGRESEDEITLFDSTGVGLQDVVAASVALDMALQKNCARKIE